MTNLEKDLLLYVLYTPRIKADIEEYLKKPRLFRHKPDQVAIQNAFDTLESGYLIEELGREELKQRQQGVDFSGIVGPRDFSSKYIATEEGVERGEQIKRESYRFWLPIAISVIALLVSILK